MKFVFICWVAALLLTAVAIVPARGAQDFEGSTKQFEPYNPESEEKLGPVAGAILAETLIGGASAISFIYHGGQYLGGLYITGSLVCGNGARNMAAFGTCAAGFIGLSVYNFRAERANPVNRTRLFLGNFIGINAVTLLTALANHTFSNSGDSRELAGSPAGGFRFEISASEQRLLYQFNW